MKITRANNKDAEVLTNLTIRSKAYWGYSSEQMLLWKDDLTISIDYITKAEVFKLMIDSKLIGYFSYVVINSSKVKLDNIFIEPNYIGKGYGKLLMNRFIDLVKAKEFKIIMLDSEPKAEQFYSNFGFNVVGQLESSIKNRFLPIMELEI